MTDRDLGTGPSWDDSRREAPSRPSFRTSLPEAAALPRPGHVRIAVVLVLVAVVAFVAVTALAGLDQAQLRADLVADLPEDATEDYTDTQIRRAVWVLLGVVAGVGALLSLSQALTIRGTAVKRSLASRTTFVTVTVLYVPVAVVAWAIRGGAMVDTVLSAVNVLLLVVATVVITRRPVSAWLRQTERTGRAPLVAPAPGDELTPAAAGRHPLHGGPTAQPDDADDDADDDEALDAGDDQLSLESRNDDESEGDGDVRRS